MQYGEFRKGFMLRDGSHDKEDTRHLFYGIRYVVENFFSKPWTMDDVEKCDAFYKCVLAFPLGFSALIIKQFL